MHIDMHGHINIRPGELLQQAFDDPIRLIDDVLVPGTPLAFANYDGYCKLLSWVGNKLGVNPRCIILRGSSKVGFSIAPKPGKAWCAFHSGSDLDVAIADVDLYHTVDREVRHYDHLPENVAAILASDDLTKQLERRRRERQFYCYRDYNLPDGLHCKQILADCIEHAPVEETCGECAGHRWHLRVSRLVEPGNEVQIRPPGVDG